MIDNRKRADILQILSVPISVDYHRTDPVQIPPNRHWRAKYRKAPRRSSAFLVLTVRKTRDSPNYHTLILLKNRIKYGEIVGKILVLTKSSVITLRDMVEKT